MTDQTQNGSKQLGLVLSGGGARGAYQAGVLLALKEIHHAAQVPFAKIIGGVSAGAINAGFLASQIDQPDFGTTHLVETWRNLHAEDVFRTDYASVSRNALKLVRGVSLGGLAEALRPVKVGLLNTAPLNQLLKSKIPFDRIQKMVDSKHLRGLAISATDYSSSFGVTFVQGQKDIEMWSSADRFSLQAQIGPDHIMASTSIPLFFPPHVVESRYYGDGCLRNTAPLSPVIHMGAEKLIVVGVRAQKRIEDFKKPSISPSLGRVLSVLINAIFMDAVEIDLERLRIVNESVQRLKSQGIEPGHKTLSALYLYPSQDLSRIAQSRTGQLPAIIRFLFNGLGTPEESAELLSYLLFEPDYCSSLVELGYNDTLSRRSEILQFFEG